MRDTLTATQPPADAGTAPVPEQQTAIRIAGVSKTYWTWKRRAFVARVSGGFQALQPTSFDVAAGEFVALVGPSGCGKTTLLKAAAGLVAPTTGEVRIGSRVVRGPGGRDTAVVFQQVGLFPWLTARENVAFALEDRGLARRSPEFSQRVTEALELVGLGKFLDAYPHQLSGGMQQRVAIARALVVRPNVLLMDEPFGALDAQTRGALQDELLTLQQSFNGSILFVTHDIEEAIYLSDRVLVMASNPGRVIEEIVVPLTRPRDSHAVRSDPRFEQLRSHIWNLLRPYTAAAGTSSEAAP